MKQWISKLWWGVVGIRRHTRICSLAKTFIAVTHMDLLYKLVYKFSAMEIIIADFK